VGQSRRGTKIEGFAILIKLIGLGLSIDSLSLGAILRLLACRKVYIDTYTSIWYPSIDIIARILSRLGIDVVNARRSDLEGNAIVNIVREALDDVICIAVPGDPMIATTHSAIVVEAFARGVEVELVPSTSILNAAISISCLQAYRFGKMVTIVKPKDGIVYETPYNVLKSNRDQGLHTVALLEIDTEKNYYMTPKEALEILIDIEKKRGEKVLEEKDIVIVLESIGFETGKIICGTVKELVERRYGKALYTLIIPARKLHPVEEECIQNITKLKVFKPIANDAVLELLIEAVAQRLKHKA